MTFFFTLKTVEFVTEALILALCLKHESVMAGSVAEIRSSYTKGKCDASYT